MYLKDLVKFGENGGVVDHPQEYRYYYERQNGHWVGKDGRLSFPPMEAADWVLDDCWVIAHPGKDACPACDGKGWTETPETTCPACHGAGKKAEKQYAFKLLTLDGKSPFAVKHGGITKTYPVGEWVEPHGYGVFVGMDWGSLQAGGQAGKNHLLALFQVEERWNTGYVIPSYHRARRLPADEALQVIQGNQTIRDAFSFLRIGKPFDRIAGGDWEPREPIIVNRVKGDTTPVPKGARVQEWWLEQDGDVIDLRCAVPRAAGYYVVQIRKNGAMKRYGCIKDPTIPTDDRGRILLAE